MVQVDEIWGYVKKKEARVDLLKDPPGVGGVYTFVGMDRSSRYVVSVLAAKRDRESTFVFIQDLRARLVIEPMLTSDGYKPYLTAIEEFFGTEVNYVQCVKNYKRGAKCSEDHRYEPPRDPFVNKVPISGTPNLKLATTAHLERQNATMRHKIGRMRRLSYAFSKKLEYHCAAIALNYLHYNLCWKPRPLKGSTPAMKVGITDHPWSLEEFVDACLSAVEVAAPTPRDFEPRPRVAPKRGAARVAPPSAAKGGAATLLAPPPARVEPPATVVEEPVASGPTPTVELLSAPHLDDGLSWKPRPGSPPLSVFGLDFANADDDAETAA